MWMFSNGNHIPWTHWCGAVVFNNMWAQLGGLIGQCQRLCKAVCMQACYINVTFCNHVIGHRFTRAWCLYTYIIILHFEMLRMSIKHTNKLNGWYITHCLIIVIANDTNHCILITNTTTISQIKISCTVQYFDHEYVCSLVCRLH